MPRKPVRALGVNWASTWRQLGVRAEVGQSGEDGAAATARACQARSGGSYGTQNGVIASRKRSDGAAEASAGCHSKRIAHTYEFYANFGVLKIGMGNGEKYEKKEGKGGKA